MNSEKVKEIKKALELNEYYAIEYFPKSGEPKIFTFIDLLTLINELESENSKFKDFIKRNDWESIEDMETTLDKAQQKCFEVAKENQKLKDRIDDLEKQMCRNEDLHNATKKLNDTIILKQFAERLIEKLKEKVNADNVDVFVECAKLSDETLKEFI